jgi:hypothetical protein
MATAVLAASLAHAQAPPAEEPRPLADDPTPAAGSSRPLSDSAARIVRNLEEDGKPRCGKISERVPCFPVSIFESRPEWTVSVRDSLGDLGPTGKSSPNRPPTPEEMKAFRPGPTSLVAPVVTFDPGCVGKSVLKHLKGKNDTYYLYRVRDVHGERAALYDHRLEPASFQGALEFLGRWDGECRALAAYRREDRRTATVRP